MFPNLKAEMARLNITTKKMAEEINKTESWVENRLSGKASLPITDAFNIKNAFFPNISFEYLYSNTAIIPFEKEGSND